MASAAHRSIDDLIQPCPPAALTRRCETCAFVVSNNKVGGGAGPSRALGPTLHRLAASPKSRPGRLANPTRNRTRRSKRTRRSNPHRRSTSQLVSDSILARLTGPADLRHLNEAELADLATEIRETIITTVAKT